MSGPKDEKAFLTTRIEDHLSANWEPYFTGFLDRRTQSELEPLLNRSGEPWAFYGAVPDAERRILAVYPDYLAGEDLEWPVGAVYIPVGFEAEHRKVLGTLMSLGIKRENAGDIQIGEDFVQIVMLDRMKDFVLTEFTKLQGHSVKPRWLERGEIRILQREYQETSVTAASDRVDAVCAALFHLSRTAAQEAVRTGVVNLNWLPVQKSDARIHAGDVLSVRKKGKAAIDACSEKTKKGRLRIDARYYK